MSDDDLIRIELTLNVVIPRWDSFGNTTVLTIRDPENHEKIMDWLLVQDSGPGWVKVKPAS